MAAEFDLDRRGEPAQVPVIAVGNDERGFTEVVLGRDRLHPFGWEETIEPDYRGRIAGEHPVGEGIDDVIIQFHLARSCNLCGSNVTA